MPKNDYYIWINGEKIPVTEEMFREYKRTEWREENRAIACSDREIPYDDDLYQSKEKLIEDIVVNKLMLEELYKILNDLTIDERNLLQDLFYNDFTERQIANKRNVSQPYIHKQKIKIINFLKNLLK